MSILSGFIFLFSDFIVNLILGDQFLGAAILLKIMSPLPLIIALSNILGIQVMLNLGLKSAFSLILTMAALGGVALSLLLVPIYQEKGTAYTLVMVEVFVTAAMFFYVKNHLKSTSS
jgi:PST family polysaccharide transporter